MLTLEKYNKLNKVLLTDKQHEHIMAWDKEHHSDFDSINFPFTELLIEIPVYIDRFQGEEINKLFHTLYYMKVTDDTIYFKMYDKEGMKEVLSFTFDNAFTGEFTDVSTMVKGANKEMLQVQAKQTVLTCYAVIQYMNHKPATIIEEKVSRQVKKKGKGGGKSKLVRVSTVKYTFDLNKEDKREYTRKTEAWPVRGHYRHYKSGKVVWIKPRVNGKGEAQGNTYTV